MDAQLEQTVPSFSTRKAWWKMIVSIIVLGGVGFVCSRYPTQHGSSWYHQLNQPFFAPPYWLPFVMWTLVYILMGCAIGIIWHYAAKNPVEQTVKLAKKAIVLFVIHLVFNLIFPILLIGFEAPVVALVDILILIIFIGILIKKFLPINKIASRLLIPYLIWIFYATALNVAIIVLN